LYSTHVGDVTLDLSGGNGGDQLAVESAGFVDLGTATTIAGGTFTAAGGMRVGASGVIGKMNHSQQPCPVQGMTQCQPITNTTKCVRATGT
jgi:hypothetical protein